MNGTKQPMIMMGIPTCKRPGMLEICLQSSGESTLPENVDVYMDVADNDVNESARVVVEKFARDAPFPVEYSVYAERGISNIRNHLFDCAIAANADCLANTNDDEGAVSATWLADLYAMIVETGADAAGPAHGERTLVKNGEIHKLNSILISLDIRKIPSQQNAEQKLIEYLKACNFNNYLITEEMAQIKTYSFSKRRRVIRYVFGYGFSLIRVWLSMIKEAEYLCNLNFVDKFVAKMVMRTPKLIWQRIFRTIFIVNRFRYKHIKNANRF